MENNGTFLYKDQWGLQVMLQSACSSIVDVSLIYNKAARRRKHNLQNPLNNTVQQDAKI
jgi:hypothetical protein